EILLPLDFDRGVEPGIRLRGTLILDIPGRAAPARLEAEAAFALWTSTMIARLSKPGRQELSDLTGGTLAKEAPPGLLETLSDKVRAEVWVLLLWPPTKGGGAESEVVLAAGCSAEIDDAHAIELVPKRLTFTAALALRVELPFNEDDRLL